MSPSWKPIIRIKLELTWNDQIKRWKFFHYSLRCFRRHISKSFDLKEHKYVSEVFFIYIKNLTKKIPFFIYFFNIFLYLLQEIFYHTIFIYERTASIKNTFSRFSEKREVSVARIHLVKNSGTRANGSSMEFRGGLSAIASPRTVLSGRCNGEPIVSPLMPRMRTTIAVRDEPSTFTAWWLMVLRASRNSIEPRAIHSRIRKRTRISKSWETGIFKRKMSIRVDELLTIYENLRYLQFF